MLLKLVLDTNTLVSAFFWEGNEAELFRKVEQGKARLLPRHKDNSVTVKAFISITKDGEIKIA